ncbi:MAG: PQQ-binding-like beta-propeller repeat protein [Planctomycetia bacterium]|nr:PQQ-binding-like beta-propeller repeat protein [Planctomycetia bacterium]
MTHIAILACLVALTWMAPVQANAQVPRFLAGRLPAADSKRSPPDRWSASENILWKTDVPGMGWSSPIVWGDRVVLTTCVNTGHTPEPRKGLYLEDVDANKYPKQTDKHEWKVLCLDLDTGKTLWEHLAYAGIPPKSHHIKNTLASETPTTDGERIYAYFGNLGLYCYDMEGKLLWSHLVPPSETNYGWGTATSPIVYQDRVYIVNDNNEKSYLLALNKRTGEEMLRIEREEKTNYATPFVWENAQRTEVVTSGIGWARSYDLDGKLLWQLKGKSILAIPTPFAQFGNLYLTSGHVVWGGNPLYAIRPGATGDISLGESQTSSDYIVWSQDKAGPYHPTPLIVGDTMYILYDRGFLAAYDAKTGREIYRRKRIPNGKGFTSSPWAYNDKLFCLNEDGVTFAFKPGPEFEILYTNPLADDDMGMATPVIVGDKLLIRTGRRIYCVGTQTPARSP